MLKSLWAKFNIRIRKKMMSEKDGFPLDTPITVYFIVNPYCFRKLFVNMLIKHKHIKLNSYILSFFSIISTDFSLNNVPQSRRPGEVNRNQMKILLDE